MLLAYAWVVLCLWVVSSVLDALPNSARITPPNVTPIMAIVAGGLFAGNTILRYFRKQPNGNGEKNGGGP